MQVHALGLSFARPTAASTGPEPLDRVVLRSADSMAADLGAELAEKARQAWTKTLGSNTEMAPAWMTANWMYDLKKEQILGQDHTPYVLPILRQSQHEAAGEVLATIDRFLPSLESPRDRNVLVESAARALRKSTVEEVRQYFGMFCAGMTDGGLEVRRHLAQQTIERDARHADVMQFGLEVARRLDDGTKLGQHQASRALYASFFACRLTSMPAEQLKIAAAGLQSHHSNTLWSEEKFSHRYPDTASLITEESVAAHVAQTCLEVLGDPMLARKPDPIDTLQRIGELWPMRELIRVAPSAGIAFTGDHVRVGGVALRKKS